MIRKEQQKIESDSNEDIRLLKLFNLLTGKC